MIFYDIFVFSFLGKRSWYSSENTPVRIKKKLPSFPAEAAVRFMSPLLKPLKKNIRNIKGADIAITYAFATRNIQK